MNKKLSKEKSAGTTDGSSTNADDMHVNPTIAKPHVRRSLLPNCKYCGKFINPNDIEVISEEIYGHLGIDCIVYYHKYCKVS